MHGSPNVPSPSRSLNPSSQRQTWPPPPSPLRVPRSSPVAGQRSCATGDGLNRTVPRSHRKRPSHSP
eukprot:scaffold1434_cov168-Pinguiococcus_pyrenoidosus.AAC.2